MFKEETLYVGFDVRSNMTQVSTVLVHVFRKEVAFYSFTCKSLVEHVTFDMYSTA